MQLCWSLDKIGPICRSADDCGLVLAAIHGADPRDVGSVDRSYVWPSSRELSTIRVGYIAGDQVESQRNDLRVLRELGVSLVPVELPTLPEDINIPVDFMEAIVTVESSAAFEDLTLRGEPKGVKLWPAAWAWGHFLSGIDYLKLSRIRGQLMQRMDQLMQTIDVCLGNDGRSLTNLTGHPKITFPNEFRESEGFLLPQWQIMFGRLYDESTLLTLVDACQSELAINRRPPLDSFLADKGKFLAGEEFPDESKLYED
jgi:Asp-tRNA(Asn)/Glu-tRNA(Gln) amidotransferase A subunit family amidase